MTANASIRSVGDLSRHRIYIEDVYPLVDGGRFPVKRTIGEEVEVWADIFRDGQVVLAAELLWRREGEKWFRVPMALHDNDRWRGSFTPHKSGRYVYAIEAWTDVFATWRRDFLAKRAAGMDIRLEVEEGRNLLADLRVKSLEQAHLIRETCSRAELAENPAPLLSDELAAAARKGQQSDLTRSANFPLLTDRPIARAAAWYEMMPRSQSSIPGKHGTFDDCINRLPDIAALGFDVLYLTPIHPIGRVNRKGRNNALRCEAGDPGSPYAIGSAEGGHDAVHPELGTLEDFRRSTLPSSARPTILGLHNIRNGSNVGPTARSNTRKTHPKSTRISSIQTFTARITKGFGKHCATSCCSGSRKAFVFFGSTTRTPNRFRSGNG